jgi:hypothetical protein
VVEGPGQECSRTRAVLRATSRQEHGAVLAARVRDPGPGPHARVQPQRVFEVALRLFPSPESGAEQPEVVRNRPHAIAGAAGVDDRPPRIRDQQVVEDGGATGIAEAPAHLGGQADAWHPAQVAVQRAEIVGGQRFELAARLVPPTHLAEHVRQRAAQAHHVGELLDQAPHHRLELTEPALDPAQEDQMATVDGEGHPVLHLLADGESLLGESLRVGEAAVEVGPHRAEHGRPPLIGRLPHLGSKPRVRLDLAVHGLDLAPLEEHPHPPRPALKRHLAGADALGEPDQLGGDGQPLLQVVGIPEGPVPAKQSQTERGRIAGPPRDLQSRD